MVRIGVAQIRVGGDKRENLATLTRFAEMAARRDARLVVFPEASMYHFGRPTDPLGQAAEPLDGPFGTALCKLATRLGVWIIAGMFERVDGSQRVRNTLVLFDEEGTLRGVYRKIHLYDAFGYRESDRMAAGDGATLAFTLGGMRFGALTCYDLRFPEIARCHALQGADVLLVPAAWLAGPLKEMQYETLLRARAIENTAYVVSADQCTDGFCGNSVIYDPHGIVVSALGEAEGLAVAELSAERLAEVRRRNPSLANARPDLYGGWASAGLPAAENATTNGVTQRWHDDAVRSGGDEEQPSLLQP